MFADADGLVAKYLKYAHHRYRAIQALLFDADAVKWNDYNLTSNTQIHSAGVVQSEASTDDANEATIASYIPLWAGLPIHMDAHEDYDNEEGDSATIEHFQSSLDRIKHKHLGKNAAASVSNLRTRGKQSRGAKAMTSATLASNLVTSLQNSGLIQAAGVLTTTLQTGKYTGFSLTATSAYCSSLVQDNNGMPRIRGLRWYG
jgi:hypothetical protein